MDRILLGLQFFQLLLPDINLGINGPCTLVIVGVIHAGAVDLLFEQLDLVLQLLLEHGGLAQLAFCLLNRCVNAIHLLLYRLILCLHVLILLAGCFQLASGNSKFSVDLPYLVLYTVRLQQEHVNIVSL